MKVRCYGIRMVNLELFFSSSHRCFVFKLKSSHISSSPVQTSFRPLSFRVFEHCKCPYSNSKVFDIVINPSLQRAMFCCSGSSLVFLIRLALCFSISIGQSASLQLVIAVPILDGSVIPPYSSLRQCLQVELLQPFLVPPNYVVRGLLAPPLATVSI